MDQQRSMFPVLKNDVILQIMEEVNVPLTESELVEPGRYKERVREVFVQLVSLGQPTVGQCVGNCRCLHRLSWLVGTSRSCCYAGGVC